MKSKFTRAFDWVVVASLLMSVATGCAGPRQPRPDTTSAIARATGIDNAIQFQDTDDATVPLPSVNVLTMHEAIRLALRADPDVQAALSRVRAAEAGADQAALLPNPILSILFRFPENSGKPVIEADLAADLLAILQRPGRIEVADSRLRAASADAITTVLDLIAEVQEHYVSGQSLDALMPVLEERRALLGRLLKLAQDRLKQGEGTNLDVTTLDAQRLELEVEIAEKRLLRRQERLTLSRLTGEPSGAVDWQLTPLQEPPPTSTSEEAWLTAAISNRPEIVAQKWELAALGVEVRLARFALFEGAGIGAKGERDSEWTVGPAITTPIPLFDWGQAKRAKAQALKIEAGHKLTKVRRQVIEEVRRAFVTFTNSLDTATLARNRLLPAQERRRSQTESAYRAGQTDITALILAEQDLQASKTKLIELEERAATALIRLQRAVGGTGVALAITANPTTTAPSPPTSEANTTSPSTQESR